MSVNVRLGDNVINNVDNVKLKDASNDSVYHTFSISAGGSKAHRLFIGSNRLESADFTVYVGSNNTTYEYQHSYDLMDEPDVRIETNDYLELLATLVGTTKANIMNLGTTIYVKISGGADYNSLATFANHYGEWRQVFGTGGSTLTFVIQRNSSGDEVMYGSSSNPFTFTESTLYWHCSYS